MSYAYLSRNLRFLQPTSITQRKIIETQVVCMVFEVCVVFGYGCSSGQHPCRSRLHQGPKHSLIEGRVINESLLVTFSLKQFMPVVI